MNDVGVTTTRRCHSKSKENTENPLIIKLMENLSASRSSQQIKGLIMFNICFFSLQILTIESEGEEAFCSEGILKILRIFKNVR